MFSICAEFGKILDNDMWFVTELTPSAPVDIPLA